MKKLWGKARLPLRQKLLDFANVERIHVIGASRSGTTLLHYALLAFDNVVACDFETHTVWHPSIRKSLEFNFRPKHKRSIFVTKRNINWYLAHSIEVLANDANKGNIGIINIVRDPRDTLTSTHANSKKEGYYTSPEMWQASIEAADILKSKLENKQRIITIRYEDLVRNHSYVQALLESLFGLKLRSGINDWSKLESNLKSANVVAGMEHALHTLRDFDPTSIGKWQKNQTRFDYWRKLHDDPRYHDALVTFMRRYSYNIGYVPTLANELGQLRSEPEYRLSA